MRRAVLRARALLRDAIKPLTDALVGAVAVGLLRVLRYFDPRRTTDAFARITRTVGPWVGEQRIGRANLTAAFPEKRPTRSRAFWPASGTISAARRRIRPYRQIWDHDPAHPENSRIEIAPRTARTVRAAARSTAKPALIFACHLGNWEFPALAGPAHGLDSAVLFRRPNSAAADRIIKEMRAVNMGTLIPRRPRRAVAAGGSAAERPACRHAGRPIFHRRRRGDVLRPQDQGQPAAGAAVAASRMSRSTARGSSACPAIASARSCRKNPAGARRLRARSMSRAPCRRSPR